MSKLYNWDLKKKQNKSEDRMVWKKYAILAKGCLKYMKNIKPQTQESLIPKQDKQRKAHLGTS